MYRTVIEAYPVIGVCKTEAVSCMLYLDCSHLQGREGNLYFPWVPSEQRALVGSGVCMAEAVVCS
jgi:hypothetical protein